MNRHFDIFPTGLHARGRRALQDLAGQAVQRVDACTQQQQRFDAAAGLEARPIQLRALTPAAIAQVPREIAQHQKSQAPADTDWRSLLPSHPPPKPFGQPARDAAMSKVAATSASRIAEYEDADRVVKRLTARPHFVSARSRQAGPQPFADPGTIQIEGWRRRRVGGVGEHAHWLYSRGTWEIRDQGSEIVLIGEQDPTAIRAWLSLAAARFSKELDLTGPALLDAEFRRQAAAVAVDLGLNIEALAAEIATERRRRQPPPVISGQGAEPTQFRIVKTHDPRHGDAARGDGDATIDTDPRAPTERMKG